MSERLVAPGVRRAPRCRAAAQARRDPQILFDEAAQGRCYTGHQFAEAFEGQAGLGGRPHHPRAPRRCWPPRATSSSFRNAQDYGSPRFPAASTATCASRTCACTTADGARSRHRRGPGPRPSACCPATSNAPRPAPSCRSRTPRFGSTKMPATSDFQPPRASAIWPDCMQSAIWPGGYVVDKFAKLVSFQIAVCRLLQIWLQSGISRFDHAVSEIQIARRPPLPTGEGGTPWRGCPSAICNLAGDTHGGAR